MLHTEASFLYYNVNKKKVKKIFIRVSEPFRNR